MKLRQLAIGYVALSGTILFATAGVSSAESPNHAPASNAPAQTSPQTGKKIRFAFENADLTQMISTYAKASGQKFVVDASVRGKATILLPGEVTVSEAFNQLSSALALNGFAISEQDDTMVIQSARNIQRNLIPVLTDLPPLKPERMVTLVISLKNVTAEEINMRLRILPSKDGEMTPIPNGNKIIVTDWVSNLYRISKTIEAVDVKASR